MSGDTNIGEELKKDIVELVDKQRELVEKGLGDTNAEVKRIDEELGKKFQEVSDIGTKAAALEKAAEEATARMDDLEKEVSLAQLSSKSGEEVRTKSDNAMVSFMRKGMAAEGFDKPGDWFEKAAGEVAQMLGKGATDRMIDTIKNDMVTGIDPNGGFLMPAAPMKLIETKVFETSPIRPYANIERTGTDHFTYVLDDDEADSGWVGEVSTRPDTDSPTVAEIKIPVHELYAQPKASQKMLDNPGFDVERWLNRKVVSRFLRQENTAFVSGDGAQKPKGFLTYAASTDEDVYQRNTVGQLTTAGSGVIVGDDLKGLVGLLKEEYQNGARFGMKRSTWTTVTKLKDTQNRYLFDMISNLRDGDIMQLLGQPVTLMNDMPAIAGSALSIVYADFNEFYTVVDGIGIRVLRDPYTSKPFVKFYTTANVGGAVTNYESGKILKIKA